MALSYKARRRWSLLILLVGLPVYIIVAISLMAWIGNTYGRQPIWVELGVYIALGFLWALPFKRVFRGIGQPDPDATEKGRPEDRP